MLIPDGSLGRDDCPIALVVPTPSRARRCWLAAVALDEPRRFATSSRRARQLLDQTRAIRSRRASSSVREAADRASSRRSGAPSSRTVGRAAESRRRSRAAAASRSRRSRCRRRLRHGVDADAAEPRRDAARRADPVPARASSERDRRADGQVERRDDEQRHRVEQHRLSLCVHWATSMIELAHARFERWAVRPIGTAADRGIAWLHWAMRPALCAGSIGNGPVATTPPTRQGSFPAPGPRPSERSYDPPRWSNASSSPRPAATAPGSSAPSRRSSSRSSTTARRSTSASRSSTTSTSSAISRRAARSSSTPRTEAPEGATIVFSAHGVAPSVHAASAELGHNVIDATCPLVTKVHVQARRYAADGYTVVLIGHAGHEEVVGTMGEAPEATVLVQDVAEAEALDLPAGRAARLHHADDALGRRDVRDHRRAPPPLPRDPRAEEGGHLLRDLQPAVGGEGDARPRSTCCS